MLNKKNSLLLMIDVQEKLVNALNNNKDEQIQKAIKIAKAAKTLGIDIITTEQYPKGLGMTIEPVRNILKDKYRPFAKCHFSAIKESDVFSAISNSEKKQIVIFGIEAHICVFQTAIELFENGYEVFVLSDASFSIKESEKNIALQNLRHCGVSILTFEMALFMWLESSKNPNFKELQTLIK